MTASSIAVDAGYEAKLYQAAPLLSIGFGAAITLAPQSMLSMRIDNALRLGGTISEQPCYDGFGGNIIAAPAWHGSIIARLIMIDVMVLPSHRYKSNMLNGSF